MALRRDAHQSPPEKTVLKHCRKSLALNPLLQKEICCGVGREGSIEGQSNKASGFVPDPNRSCQGKAHCCPLSFMRSGPRGCRDSVLPDCYGVILAFCFNFLFSWRFATPKTKIYAKQVFCLFVSFKLSVSRTIGHSLAIMCSLIISVHVCVHNTLPNDCRICWFCLRTHGAFPKINHTLEH